jgi:hypothetical protein
MGNPRLCARASGRFNRGWKPWPATPSRIRYGERLTRGGDQRTLFRIGRSLILKRSTHHVPEGAHDLPNSPLSDPTPGPLNRARSTGKVGSPGGC